MCMCVLVGVCRHSFVQAMHLELQLLGNFGSGIMSGLDFFTAGGISVV